MRLDQVLALLVPQHSRSRLQSWIKDGFVTVNRAAASSKLKVFGGEQVTVRPQASAEQLAFRAEDIDLNILFEDDALLVINKPAGLVVHPGSGNWEGTMLNALLHHAPALKNLPRAGIVHRLDKNTSGLLVVAKTMEAQTNLVRQLQGRSVKREYLAIVDGVVAAEGRVDAPIGRDPRERTRMAIAPNGKPSVTHYRPVECFAQHTLLMCRLETGRTHQIRVHLRSIDHALLGDPVYRGKPRGLPPDLANEIKAFGRQALHATRLGLVHPVSGQAMEWHAPLPVDMAKLVDMLRREAT
ncbi:MAG: 23S rRNA pseudouridine(1911/1915/1917) synthase RluD [Pseudomonadota bacterium]|nr:23S rRNA pseudouridine(1911/1915/1917) synthase RluD [Pseudomonadota bacterium]